MNYTLGIYFNKALDEVLLIKKNRPEWQKGMYNFPGGKIEKSETAYECISREFYEECGIKVPIFSWKRILHIINRPNYNIDVFVTTQDDKYGVIRNMEDETLEWFYVDRLPNNIIFNLRWMVPYALDSMGKGNSLDQISFGIVDCLNKV